MEQETLIYIDDKQKYDASVAANFFTNNDIKNRVYTNTLGAELGIKYLNSENIDTSDLKNMHSIKKIIEKFDIADIKLNGINIDVRVVFDENAIFVPKSHFEYGLVPDIYIVLKIEKDYSHVAFLGFFEPKLINKNNANDEYYFIEKEKLSPALDLAKYIESNKSGKDTSLSSEVIEKCEDLIISMIDDDISENNKKYLLEQLTNNSELREKFIEYETFEILSYKAMTDPSVDKHNIAQDITPVDEFESFNENSATDLTDTDNETLDILTQENINPEASDITEIIENTDAQNGFNEDINLDNLDSILVEPAEEQETNEIENTDSLDLLNSDADAGTTITAAGLATASAGMAAGAEPIIDDIVETTSANAQEIIEKASDMAEDLVDLASDNAEDVINDINNDNNIEQNETIDLPNENEISDSNFDISELQGNIMEDAVALNDVNIDTNVVENNTLPEDAISVDNVSINETVEEVKVEPIEKFDLPNENEILDNNFDISELQGNILEDAVALNDVDVDTNVVENNTLPEDAISLETIDIPDIPEDKEEDFQLDLDDESSYMDTFPEEKPDSRLDDSISLDDIDDSHVGGDIIGAFGLDVDDSNTEDLIIDSEENSSESFGKNLLGNLSEEDDDNILIDGIDIIPPNDIKLEQSVNEDLLSQVDDIIDKAALSDTPVEPIKQEDNIEGTDLLDTLSTTDVETSDLEDLVLQNKKNDNTVQTTTNNFINETDDSHLESEVLQENSVIENVIPDGIEPSTTDKTEVAEADTTDVNTSEPQDFVEELLDTENTTPSEESEAEGENLDVLYTESEESAQDATQSFGDIEELEDIEPDPAVVGAPIMNQQKQQSGGKILILAAVMVGLIAAASAFYFIKPKDNNVADFEPLPNNSSSALTDNKISNNTDKPVTSDKSQNSDNAKTDKITEDNNNIENVLKTNAPDVKQTKETTKKQVVKELKSNLTQKPISTAYMSVSKLVWDVPDNISYSTRMQNYLRTTGRSIKLTLSTDLLLATEYAYADSVKTGIVFGKDGSIQSVKIISSSGSSQIDNIVLQSVKETLNAIKPPVEDVKGKELSLNLIIYF